MNDAILESVGVSQKSRSYDEGAIIFVVEPSGKVHEQWFVPECGHAVEDENCPQYRAEQEARQEARERFYSG